LLWRNLKYATGKIWNVANTRLVKNGKPKSMRWN